MLPSETIRSHSPGNNGNRLEKFAILSASTRSTPLLEYKKRSNASFFQQIFEQKLKILSKSALKATITRNKPPHETGNLQKRLPQLASDNNDAENTTNHTAERTFSRLFFDEIVRYENHKNRCNRPRKRKNAHKHILRNKV